MKCRKLFSLLLLCAALLLCALAPAGAASLSEIDCIYATTPHTLLPVGEEIAFSLHYDGAAALGDYEITAEFLRKPIDEFFENVMVMDDDASVRVNNMKLLNRFVSVFAHVADFGKMAKSK